MSAFVAVMAWGYGSVGYGPYRTTRVLSDTPDAGKRLLAVTRTLADEGALAAYRRLASPRDCRLLGLGPAFGTKYLYFCQPPDQEVTALIHDALVSTWLLREAGLTLSSAVWSVSTYRHYLELMHKWAAELACRPDELEYGIFAAMAADRGSQWAP